MMTWKSVIRLILIFGLFVSCTSGVDEDEIDPDEILSVSDTEEVNDELDDEFDDLGDADDLGDVDDLGVEDDFEGDLDGEFSISETVDSDFDSSFDDLDAELSEGSVEGAESYDEFAEEEVSTENIAGDELGNQGFSDDDFTDEFINDANEGVNPDFVVAQEVPTGIEGAQIQDESQVIGNSNVVTNLEYKSFDQGGTVVIELSSPPVYSSNYEKSLNQVVIEVEDSILPERFKRPYLTKDFDQDVASINGYQAEGTKTAKFVVQLKRPVNPVVEVSGNSILVLTSQEPEPVQLAQENDSYQPPVSNEQSYEAQSPEVESYDNRDGNGLPEDSNTLAQIDYKGRKINLEYADTPVRDVVQMIAEDSGVNLIIDKDVEGTVNLRLRDVPWDQALNVVLKSQGLGYRRDGNVLRIAKQKTLSDEATNLKNQIENENKAKLEAGGLKVKYIPVSYAKVEDMKEKLKDFLSEKGAVTTDVRTSSIVISDYAEYIQRISKLIKAMDTPPLQVEIESKIIEAREEFTRDIGINLGFSGQQFNLGGTRNGQFDLNLPNNFQRPRGLFSNFRAGSFNILGNLTATLSLYENQNKIKILSSPRVMVMNKEQSTISQTTQIPVRTQTIAQGAVTESINFKDVALSLGVTPQVTFKGDVILDVEVKREFVSGAETQAERAINSREARTTVMVKNGETAVIAGIYENDKSDLKEGVPLLKDIPVVGGLFRFKQKIDNKNELLVFLRPRIVKNLNDAIIQSNLNSSDGTDEFADEDIEDGEIL